MACVVANSLISVCLSVYLSVSPSRMLSISHFLYVSFLLLPPTKYDLFYSLHHLLLSSFLFHSIPFYIHTIFHSFFPAPSFFLSCSQHIHYSFDLNHVSSFTCHRTPTDCGHRSPPTTHSCQWPGEWGAAVCLSMRAPRWSGGDSRSSTIPPYLPLKIGRTKCVNVYSLNYIFMY